MKTLFTKILYELEKEHDLMLVTILSGSGSSPRGKGAQMLVNIDGRMLGTVGGGPVEKLCEEKAIELIAGKESHRQQFLLYQNDMDDIGAVCGGEVEVYFQYIDGHSNCWREIAGCVVSAISEKKEAWLIQRTDGEDPSVLDADGNVLAGPMIQDIGLRVDGCAQKDEYFSMKLPIGERAILFGGGHCSAALAPLLNTIGFRVTVMDCREAFANKERFPFAEEVICGDYQRISDYLTLDKNDYVVIMTSGHRFDFEIEQQVLRVPLAYVGVIGSRRKTAWVNSRLMEAGVPEDAIQRVHTPVGMAIKAVTPEEIAVSIAGEMILVRANYREAAGYSNHECPMC